MEGIIPGNNGGQQSGAVGTAERPGLTTILKTEEPKAGTETDKEKSFSSIKSLKEKEARINERNRKRKHYDNGALDEETEKEDDIVEIEKSGRAELEEIILEGKKGVSKFLTQLGLKVGVINPYKAITNGKKALEKEVREYARENGRCNKEISKLRREIDKTSTTLEECYTNDNEIGEVTQTYQAKVGKLKAEIGDGLKTGKDVSQTRTKLRGKEDYLRFLEEQKLENAYDVKQKGIELKDKEDYLKSFSATRDEILKKIYEIRNPMPIVTKAGQETKVTIDTAKHDGKVAGMLDTVIRMAEIANRTRYTVEATSRGNGFNVDYDPSAQTEEMKLALEKRTEAMSEAAKVKQDVLDAVQTSKARYMERYN